MGTTVFQRSTPAASAIDEALAETKQSVFWLDDLPRRTPNPPLSGRVTADLVVVGGGYHGLWTALLATERNPGVKVIVLEAAEVGWAASGRNGGFIEASLTHGYQNGFSRWPDEIDTLERLGHENLRELSDTIDHYAMSVDLERTGSIAVAVEDYQRQELQTTTLGEHEVFLDDAQLQASIASPTYLAGVWDKEGTMLAHPAKLVRELARVAQERGALIFERSRVTDIQYDSSRVIVRTEDGEALAPHAVLATNAFPSLLMRNRLMTVPVYDYVLATEPLTRAQRKSIGWRDRQGLADMANLFHYYRQTADHRIVFGGYDAVYHFGGKIRASYEDRPETFRKLASHFLTTFPQLEGVRFSHKWAGVIDTCSQFCAFYGTSHRGRVAYAAGFTGLGVGATRFAANVMLDLLAGESTERTELKMVRRRPLPFPPEPAASAGINTVRWCMESADRNNGKRNLLLKTLDAMGLGFDS